MDSCKISWARISARIDSRILDEFLAVFQFHLGMNGSADYYSLNWDDDDRIAFHGLFTLLI